MLDADAACSHFDDGCTAVQAGDVNAPRASVGLSYGCVDGSVLGPKLAEFEQVAAARRAKSSRPGENPLQRGAKRDIASRQIVLFCASKEAVGPAAAEAAAECRSMNK